MRLSFSKVARPRALMRPINNWALPAPLGKPLRTFPGRRFLFIVARPRALMRPINNWALPAPLGKPLRTFPGRRSG
jgi:hypothetical protein